MSLQTTENADKWTLKVAAISFTLNVALFLLKHIFKISARWMLLTAPSVFVNSLWMSVLIMWNFQETTEQRKRRDFTFMLLVFFRTCQLSILTITQLMIGKAKDVPALMQNTLYTCVCFVVFGLLFEGGVQNISKMVPFIKQTYERFAPAQEKKE